MRANLSPMPDQAATTAAQLLELDEPGFVFELVRGELRRMSAAGHRHGAIAARVARHIGNFVAEHGLGECYGAETGFHLERDPDTVRAPDFAFVRRDRLPLGDGHAYFPGPPDLAVEVVSPNDRFTEVDEKAADWIAHGARLVWVVNPQRRSVLVYAQGGATRSLGEHDTLDGGDALPGLSLRVADLFPST